MAIFNGGGVSGVSPQKFDAGLDEVKQAISGVQSGVTEIGIDTDAILAKLGTIETSFAEIQGNTSTILSVVNDILLGRQLSEWIADLAASGKQSGTYANAERMNALIADADACKNITVNQHILDWGIANNKTGVFYKSYLGTASGATWDSLTTPTSICTNSTAFSAICNNSAVLDVTYENSTMRKNIFTNRSATHSILRKSSTAMSLLQSKAQRGQRITSGINTDRYKSVTKNMFVLYVQFNNEYVEVKDGSTSIFRYRYGDFDTDDQPEIPAESQQATSGYDIKYTINKFATEVGVRSFTWMDTGYASSTLSNWQYVDFS